MNRQQVGDLSTDHERREGKSCASWFREVSKSLDPEPTIGAYPVIVK